MDEQQYLELISGKSRSLTGGLLRPLLRVASWPYAAVMSVRNSLFDRDLLPIYETPAPVISVGNVTTGGTGKTPVVALVVQWLAEAGAKPGIVSRGYKQLAEGGNDEARVLELLCPGVPHVQNRDRVAATFSVTSGHDCNVIVADDAFQHRRMARTLDVVLIDACQPWGHGFVLPRGLLREPRCGLRRADVVVMTRADQVNEEARAEIWNDIRRFKPNAPEIEIAFRPDSLLDITGQRSTVDSIAEPVFAFCGIGNPKAFRQTLEQHGLQVAGLHAFPDHHHYESDDIVALQREAATAGASQLITTVKDLVKLNADWLPTSQLVALDIRSSFLCGESAMKQAVTQTCSRDAAKPEDQPLPPG